MAERGAFAEVNVADDGSTAAQCAYRPCGVFAVAIDVQFCVGASNTWMSDMTIISGCESMPLACAWEALLCP